MEWRHGECGLSPSVYRILAVQGDPRVTILLGEYVQSIKMASPSVALTVKDISAVCRDYVTLRVCVKKVNYDLNVQ